MIRPEKSLVAALVYQLQSIHEAAHADLLRMYPGGMYSPKPRFSEVAKIYGGVMMMCSPRVQANQSGSAFALFCGEETWREKKRLRDSPIVDV
jgi:hypothetical protein